MLCDLHFKYQPAVLTTDQSKIAFIISHLSGRAEAWVTAEWARDSPVYKSLEQFTKTLRKVFNQTSPGREAARALVNIKQVRRRISDFAIEFRTIAADNGWNAAALFDAFLNGLAESIKDQLAPLDLSQDLDSLISMAICIDNRLQERQREKNQQAVHLLDHRGPSP